jgi:glycosyltransferase involved in cell wall biosynthesis
MASVRTITQSGYNGVSEMSDDPAVSFVVPAYNEEALLASCLSAIQTEIARSQCRAEIIVVNNGSTDGTRQIAASIPEAIIIDEPQRGLVQARRAGCRAARGKLIANIDADTILTEGWLGTALLEFHRNSNLAALSGPFVHYDLPRYAQWMAAAFFRLGFVACLAMRFVVGAGSMMQGGNFIVSKSALDAAGGFNPDFRFYGEDTELARRLSKVGVVKFSFALPALSSGRRFAAEGLFRVGLRYAANYLWTIFFGHPYSPTWLDFRHPIGPNGRARPAPATPLRTEPPAS